MRIRLYRRNGDFRRYLEETSERLAFLVWLVLASSSGALFGVWLWRLSYGQ
jgi:hypothetical protein